MGYFKLTAVIALIVSIYAFIGYDIYSLIVAFSWYELAQLMLNLIIGYIFALALYKGAKSVID